MFEHTLAGTMPSERSFRLGPVSAAVIIHAAVLLAIVAVSVLTLRSNPGPEAPMMIVLPPRLPDLDPIPAGNVTASRPAGRTRENREAAQPPPPARPEPPPIPSPEVESLSPVETTDNFVDATETGENLSGNGSGPSGPGSGTGNGPGGDGDGEGVGEGPGNGTGSGPFALGAGIAPPRLIVKVQPDYPAIARKSRLEGEVVLRAVVGPDGTVSDVTVIRSSSPMFDAAARDAVRQWLYTPPKQEGRPVSVWFEVVVRFVLR